MEISEDFIVKPWLNGIKLEKPDLRIVEKNTVRRLFQFNFNVYFSLENGVIRKINDSTAKNCGFISAEDAEYRTIEKVAKKETVDFENAHDHEVITSKTLVIKEELFFRNDDYLINALSIKTPWYDNNDKDIGIFGFSILMQDKADFSLADSLKTVIDTGLLAPNYSKNLGMKNEFFISNNHKNIYLSQRQIQCIKLLMRGKTAKQIAQTLGLSFRTVQNYIENIKMKMNVKSKNELVEKAYDSIFSDFN